VKSIKLGGAMSDSLLARELKKRKPFELLEQEAHLNLIRTTDQLQIHFARLFRVHGITIQQYNILRILRGEGRPLPSLEIASRMIQVVPAITGLVDRLETAGFVVRRRCQEDRRVVYVELAPKAVELLAEIDEPLRLAHRRLLRDFSKSELTELIRLLEKSRVAIERYEESTPSASGSNGDGRSRR
jgi:MarR family 2-MHQ and catechol resistance regulon transcriptional repressor